MKIVFIENSKIPYNSHDKDNSLLRGAELAIIHLSECLAQKGNEVIVLNNCKKDLIINKVYYKNINYINSKIDCNLAIANADANLFKHVISDKNFLFSHSVQNFEKFIRKKQLIPFIKYRPIVLCSGKYHYNKRSFLTALFGKKIITPSIDSDFFSTNIPNKINKDVIFYSRADRNSNLVIKIWKELFNEYKLTQNFYVSTDLNINQHEMKIYNIFKKDYFQKDKLIDFLKNFRILIIPGHKGETFCNVAEEAKALGIPIVTLGYGALYERVQNNYNGFLCKNIDDFKLKILNLLQDDKLYLKFKHNLIKDRGLIKWRDTANKILELFKEK
jgi:glycosyltransferase involved in cell wall biosynthesis